MKAMAILMISGMLTYNGVVPASTDNTQNIPPGNTIPVEEQLGEILSGTDSMSKFVNNVDGYEISVPNNMTVDMSLSEIRTVFENEYLTLEIYREDSPKSAYINYSKGFIKNGDDHTKEFEKEYTLDGKTAYLLQWSRPKLSKIPNDKNHYATIDIVAGPEEVYTLFFKSKAPFWEIGGYDVIADTFKTVPKTAEPVMTQFPNEHKPNWNLETKALYQKYFSPSSPLTWGIFEPTAPGEYNTLTGLETQLDYHFPFIVLYKSIRSQNEPYLQNLLNNSYKNGATLELTLQTNPSEEGNMIYDVLEGKYDSYLNDFAAQVKLFGHPILFRLANEMNGDWCVYSAYHTSIDTNVYKAFYKYVYEIFEKAGANENTIWVWNPHDKSFPDFKWNDANMYYPGDEYVDIVGMTGYNNGTYYSAEKWRSFTKIYDELYNEYCAQYAKPLMITEFASSSVGGNKEAWVDDMFDQIKNYDRIKVAIWWNGRDLDADGNVARPYWLNETPELIQVFKNNLQEYRPDSMETENDKTDVDDAKEKKSK